MVTIIIITIVTIPTRVDTANRPLVDSSSSSSHPAGVTNSSSITTALEVPVAATLMVEVEEEVDLAFLVDREAEDPMADPIRVAIPATMVGGAPVVEPALVAVIPAAVEAAAVVVGGLEVEEEDMDRYEVRPTHTSPQSTTTRPTCRSATSG
jgi:hypothetical protein